ncbi:MAG: chain-length determining protein, partial [Sphingomonadales bacterium]
VQIVALTSALPEEGKTTTALALARVLGINGTKTLLIDCDLRKASLQSLMADDVDVGLVEVLNGSKTAEQAIVQDRVEAVDLLPVARKLFTGEDMFGSDRMKALLDSLRPHYQTIILDLPPVMGVADARSLSVLADAAVLIVRWGSTPPRAADTAVTWLRGDGANLLGAVYTLVDPNSEAVGGLFYSSKYASYYQQA